MQEVRGMKLIAVSPALQGQGPGAYQALERGVRRTMEPTKGSVNSASGMTASLAINYCERMGFSYRVTASPDGYFVERL